LISGGFTIIAQRIARQLGMDSVFANELVVDDGVLTGDVRGPLTRQNSKKEVLEEICNKLNISPRDCIAVGDGSNDLCWVGVVGTFIAFNAKPVVQRAADVVVDGKNMESLIPIIKEEYIRHAKRTARKETKIP
jgi:phosphoserine phosphatase